MAVPWWLDAILCTVILYFGVRLMKKVYREALRDDSK